MSTRLLGTLNSTVTLLPSINWHMLGLALFVSWNDVLHNPPIHYTDYAFHYAEVVAARHFLEANQLWGYDPFFHAGFPGGTLFNADNKGIELASWALARLGIPLPQAFDMLVLSLIALAPFCVYLAARILKLSPRAAGLAQLMALALWYGDPTVRWMWQGGTFAFAAAALGSLAVAAAFWHWAGQRERTTGSQILWFGLGPLLFWLHPWTFFTLVVPLGTGTALSWSRWTWRARLVVLLWVVWVLLLNWPWLSLILRFMDTKTSSAQFLQGGLSQLLADLQAPHTALRLAVLGLAVVGLWAWRRNSQSWWLPASANLVALLMLAYVSVYLGGAELQPYRFVMPALMLGTLPAADGVVRIGERAPRHALLLLAAFGLIAALPLYRGRPQGRLQADGTPAEYLSGPRPAEQAVCHTLQRLDLQSGRVLTNDWRLGAYLPVCSSAQVIGGPFLWVFTIYGYANASLDDLFSRPIASLSLADMKSLLAQYNVRWVVINTSVAPKAYTLAEWQRDHPGLLTALVTHDIFEVHTVQQPASWFFQGTGQVMATYNRLEVRNASLDGLLLKYHWLDSLRAEPLLPLRPVYVGQDPVPFIAVDNGSVSDFVIVQHYE